MSDEPTLYYNTKNGCICYSGEPQGILTVDIPNPTSPTTVKDELFYLRALKSIEITPNSIIFRIRHFRYIIPHTAKTYRELEDILHSNGK